MRDRTMWNFLNRLLILAHCIRCIYTAPIRRLLGRPPSVTCWLYRHPKVAWQVRWQFTFDTTAYDVPEAAQRPWIDWTAAEKQELQTAFDAAWTWLAAQSGTSLLSLKTRHRIATTLLAVFLLCACTAPERYTSLDLALLPCEPPGAPVFFSALEFRADGSLLYPQQKDALIEYLERGQFADLFFFLHGWNKNPSSAESDYQNFICRFHGKLNDSLKETKRQGKLKVVGIFWPSTITNREQEPVLLKPFSYYRIRNRVDALAQTALAPLLDEIGDVLITLDQRLGRSGEPRRVHLVGHSFGGRMIIRSFQQLSDDGQLVPILQSVEATNVILINAAAPPTFFDWISDAALDAWLKGAPTRFSDSTGSYLLNLYSDQDSANKYLFRMASTFNDDPPSCAVGACGIPDMPTLCVDQAGKVVRPEIPASLAKPELNVRNIDTSRIVYGHSDIYKGRMASLVADLLYDPPTRALLEVAASVDPRCD